MVYVYINCTCLLYDYICVSTSVSPSDSGWKGVRRRVSQRPGATTPVETGTERPKPGPPTMTCPNQNQNPIPSRSPSPPPNWACAVRSAPPPAAASATSPHSDDRRLLWLLQCLCRANRYVLTSLLCCSQERRKHTAGRLDTRQDPKWLPPFPFFFFFL